MTSGTHSPESFRRTVLSWYREHGRHDLPWRQTRDPYAVLISEVMLQQTQVDRVVPYYLTWMERWTDVAALAAASPGEVIRAWAGLGYNRRALNLHRAAVVVTEEREGLVPSDETKLRSLPGIGPYTAAAVACFAGGRRTVVLDTNIGRVIVRSRIGAADAKTAGDKDTREMADALLPPRSARDWNLALMDLGAMVCTSRNPGCEACPVTASCAWRRAGYPSGAARNGKAVRFEDTARFARGRIVDALRQRETMDESELAVLLPAEHGARLSTYIEGLTRDGLIVRVPGTARSWMLPGYAVREE